MRVIAIFDIGKTNKKFFLLNEQYEFVSTGETRFEEVLDEDGFPCDDLQRLSQWVLETVQSLSAETAFEIVAYNFSAYGASFVHLDGDGQPVTPLYNYLKPCAPDLKAAFYDRYGPANELSLTTASPALENLNSGLQLYALKHGKPNWFKRVRYSLHLPQYISHIITGKYYTDITSIGCHTSLWNFIKDGYHDWVYAEKINEKLPPLWTSDGVCECHVGDKKVIAGVGLHDSSAALIPYLAGFKEPFILISTGTWCITLNPFNQNPLTAAELEQDCLMYLQYNGKPVKASRLFAGNEHEQQAARIAKHFGKPTDHYNEIEYQAALPIDKATQAIRTGIHPSAFVKRDILSMPSYDHAYHQLIYDIIQQQRASANLVFTPNQHGPILVDGGFARNKVYMHMLAIAFPDQKVYAAHISQASALGAALAIHNSWNRYEVPENLVKLEGY